jgi:hypothetical protein
VYVNVYDIPPRKVNKYLELIGMGIYHTGIEVNGTEYAYGGNALLTGTGVYEIAAKKHEAFVFKESIQVGVVSGGKEAVW